MTSLLFSLIFCNEFIIIIHETLSVRKAGVGVQLYIVDYFVGEST